MGLMDMLQRMAADVSEEDEVPKVEFTPEPAPQPAPALQWMTKAGKCANGCERDHGTIAHLIPQRGKALCGETTRSWWSEVRPEGGSWPRWVRKCSDCERMQILKAECPVCGHHVMKTATGLRAHKCRPRS